jgi:hypothetical protein
MDYQLNERLEFYWVSITHFAGLCPRNIAAAKRFGVRQLAAAFEQASLLAVQCGT